MRPTRHRFLSYVLLATYAGISLLGEGLHELLPEEGHHHGLCFVTRSSHAGVDDCDAGLASSRPGEPAVEADNCNSDSHVCEICAFLYQAISQPAEVAAPIDWQPLVVAAQANSRPSYFSTSLGPQAARGPPLFLG
jgi:hypothetical protein